MIERINFTSVTIPPLEGYVLDIGEKYDLERGYGWITEDSVGSENPTPLDITPNTRDRNSLREDNFDSLIHLQYKESFNRPNAVTTPAAWEYDLANGTYLITVGVGDSDFTDSSHVINVEGITFIDNFVPTEEDLFEVKAGVVEVTDGKLSIDAIGGENTKLNFVEIAPAEDEDAEIVDIPVEITPIDVPDDVGDGGIVPTVRPVEGGININFGTPAFDTPSGFIQDIGEAYNSDRGYGWVTEDSANSSTLEPIDIVANGRDRDTIFIDEEGEAFVEPALDSLMHMQYPTGLPYSSLSVTTPAAWEYDIANGSYEVTVGVGDPDYADSLHVINVEGETAISGFEPILPENDSIGIDEGVFATGTITVEVNDGRLTVDAIGGENTKINYISILPVDSDS